MKRMFYVILMLVLTITGCTPARSISVPVPEPDYWPTREWKSTAPEAQGMDSELLAKMIDDISANKTNIYSVLVIRNGYMVTEAYFHPYTRDTKVHIQSITKSVIGMLVGKAINLGAIKSVDETLVSYFPGREFANPSKEKESIRLSHLLSMSSGLDCQEFSSTSPKMEQSAGWVQFMLDLPVTSTPGKSFGYCNGNAHLLSALVEKATGMNTREFANQELFRPLGIAPVELTDWGRDPKGYTIGGYGLHLRPVDLAKLAFLYLQNGKWDGKQVIPADWVAVSTTQQVEKEDGSGYGYLWTVYPKAGHYAALGLGGQQIHVFPGKNLIVVVTGGLEAYAEAPEIEKMLNEYILPSIKSDGPLTENKDVSSRLQKTIEHAGNPVESVADLPETARVVSGSTYIFPDNPVGWKKLRLVFTPGAKTTQLYVNDFSAIDIGLDNIFRLSNVPPLGELLLRGRWRDADTFVGDYPYSMFGTNRLGELGETEIQFKFSGDRLDVTIIPLIFGGESITFSGKR
jgi:CubicO group peptidase (beta-lactamase class C family)